MFGRHFCMEVIFKNTVVRKFEFKFQNIIIYEGKSAFYRTDLSPNFDLSLDFRMLKSRLKSRSGLDSHCTTRSQSVMQNYSIPHRYVTIFWLQRINLEKTS